MLATDLRDVLEARGEQVSPVDLGDLDLLDEAAVSQAVSEHDVVVNCAAWTAVDEAETQEGTAFLINAVAPGLIARAAELHGALVVQISTDYVFSGEARLPYAEGAAPGPRSAYGRTKLAGEWAVRAEAPTQHLILRTAWLYGAHGNCFPRTIARVAGERDSLSVVDDQSGQPTWTRDLALLLVRLVGAGARGTRHATSGGATTWHEFAREVVTAGGLSPDMVRPTDSATFERPAPRPAYSVLGHDRLQDDGIAPIGDWRERWRAAASEVLALDQL